MRVPSSALRDLSPELQRMLAPFATDNPGGSPQESDGSSSQAVHESGTVGVSRLRLVIHGEPASKANSRKIVLIKGQYRSIKSDKARSYEQTAYQQALAQARRVGWSCVEKVRFRVSLKIFYRSELPDLDESLVLDVLQGIVYANDRQVREKHVFHAIDAAHPRVEIIAEPLQGQLL